MSKQVLTRAAEGRPSRGRFTGEDRARPTATSLSVSGNSARPLDQALAVGRRVMKATILFWAALRDSDEATGAKVVRSRPALQGDGSSHASH